MKKTILMSAAKKARIALAVMAVFGMSFVGARSVFAADYVEDSSNTIDAAASDITVVGRVNNVKGKKAIVVGDSNYIDATAEEITVFGRGNYTSVKNTILMGAGNEARFNAEEAVLVGKKNYTDSSNTLAVGASNLVYSAYNIALGRSNSTSYGYATAVGYNNKARGLRAVAFGADNVVGGDGAYNYDPATSASGAVGVGVANNVSGNYSGAVGIKNEVVGLGGTIAWAFGFNNKASGQCSVTLGSGNTIESGGLYGAALGRGNKIYSNAKNGIAIGTANEVGIKDDTSWKESFIAIGNDNQVKKHESIALGCLAKTYQEQSIAIGSDVNVITKGAIGFGCEVGVSGEGAVALGSAAHAYKKNSVALGYGSLANDDNVVSVGNEKYTYKKQNGSNRNVEVAENYRRIVNMSDGTNNHDAATYGQIIKKDTYTISLDNTGNGNAVLKTNANNDGPTIKVDASALETQITKNASDITAVDNKIGSMSADGTYIKKDKNVSENLVALDKQVKANADDITIAKDTIRNVSNKIGTKYDGNYIHAVNPIGSDLVALDKQVKVNADAITAVDNKIGSLSTDGAYIKKTKNVSDNLVELDNQVNANATALTSKANLDLSNINAAGETKIKDLAKTEAGTVLTGELGTITSTNYVSASGKVNENISKLDTQVKANADDIIAANTKITNVDNKIGSLSTDGTYIKKTKNVSDNLVELDNQVNANATALTSKANLDLSNITVAGETKIKDLASIKAGEVVNVKLGAITSTHYVSTGNTVNANISALDTQLKKVDNKIGTMTNGNYIGADKTVAGNLSALDNQLKVNTDAIAEKADKDLKNITDEGKNVIKELAGNKAGEVVNAKLGDITSENYVKKDDTVNANISALDNQVKANAEAIGTKADKDLKNISTEGENKIKELAGNKAGEVVNAKLGDITSENYVKKADTVNENISALDKQMKVNTDNIGDTSKLNGLGSNLSDAVVTVNNKVGTADELKALKDAGLGDNLAQATAAVNKKADKNAEAIKTVNGRVDELGGRVDTLGGAVAKLDSRVNKVGAGAAALAALHPMEFDSDNKLSFAAGLGNYRGTNAAAIGAFYRPSEQVMFSISGNMGNGENMVNAGVSFALDRPSKTPTTKAALVKTVVAQNEQIAALNETLAEQNEKIARLEAMVEKLAAQGK